MKGPGLLFLLAAFTLGATGCQNTPTPLYDFEKDTDFSRFSTFTWIDETPLSFHEMTSHVSPLVEERLKVVAKNQFSLRGLGFVEVFDEADLLLSFTIGSRDQILLEGYSRPSVYPDAYTDGSYWIDNGRYLGKFVEGQVCIDLFDRVTGKPVWHGTVREPIFEPDMDYWRERVGEVVAQIAAGYPPDSSF